MDIIETALDSSGDKDLDCEDDKVSLAHRLALDHGGVAVRDSSSPLLAPGFTLRPDPEHSGSTLAIRVVQFNPDGSVDQGSGGSVTSLLTTGATTSPHHHHHHHQQSNGSPTESPETRLALITSGDVPNDAGAVVVSGGQFYVIGDVLTNSSPRSLAPRTPEGTLNPRLGSSTREEKRRVTHNEVERRRRDKINTWICRLAKIIPDCPEAHSKNAQFSSQSKGGILAKACDYISDLKQQNEHLSERVKQGQRRDMDLELLKQEVEVLKNENAALKNENALARAQLQQQQQQQQQSILGDLPP